MDAAVLGKLLASLIWGLVVGLLAKRKHRNPWGWGVAGALSWLIALLILAFMPYKCPKCRQSLTNDQGKEKDCPSCGSFKSNVAMTTNDLINTHKSNSGRDIINKSFQQMASDTTGKHNLNAAKQVITECLNSLNYREAHRELASYLPIAETVARLNDHATKEKLNAEELALLLIDAGMADHSTATGNAESMFGAAFHTALGEGSKDMARSLVAAGLARHDRLLTEVFKRAVEKGTHLVPQYGSAGTAMKNALGTQIEPPILPEQKSNNETPRDRDRAMSELIKRMKHG